MYETPPRRQPLRQSLREKQQRCDRVNNLYVPSSPKTGDDARILPYALGMGVSGMFLMIPAVGSMRRKKKNEEENA